jgi:4-hydroxybenzoate polyprenyltransferase
LGVGVATGVFWVNLLLGGALLALCLKGAGQYARTPSDATEKRMDTLAGLWVFACYAIAGFAPVIIRLF